MGSCRLSSEWKISYLFYDFQKQVILLLGPLLIFKFAGDQLLGLEFQEGSSLVKEDRLQELPVLLLLY